MSVRMGRVGRVGYAKDTQESANSPVHAFLGMIFRIPVCDDDDKTSRREVVGSSSTRVRRATTANLPFARVIN